MGVSLSELRARCQLPVRQHNDVAGLLFGDFASLPITKLFVDLRWSPNIATLGMLGVARGTAKWFAGQQTVNVPETWVNELLVTFPKPAWLLVAPAYWFGSIVAYYAVTAIGVIGLYIAYVIPTFLRLRAKEAFKPGPWTLGAKGRLIGWIAVVWVIFVCIILCLPQFNWGDLDGDPSTAAVKLIDVFNFAPVVVVGLFVVIGLWYALSARKWFVGPKVQGTPEELAAIEAELEGV